VLVEAFRNGEDIHTRTASEVMGVPPLMVTPEARRNAKAVNFGIVYGISPFGLAAQLGIEQREARRYIERLFRALQGRAQVHRRARIAEVRRDGRSCARSSGASGPFRISPAAIRTARICRAHRREHAAAGHRRGPDQAGHGAHRSPNCASASCNRR
jgi:hypothetical protein